MEKGAPSAGPIGTRSPAFPVGTRSVRDVVLPLIPSEPGLTHRVLLGPAVTEVVLTRVRPLGEGHAGRDAGSWFAAAFPSSVMSQS